MKGDTIDNWRIGGDDSMVRANVAARGLHADCAIFLEDFMDRRVRKETRPARCAVLHHSGQLFEGKKRRLPGIISAGRSSQPARDGCQALDWCAD